MQPPLILLPPSEGKRPGGGTRRSPDRFHGALCEQRRAVAAALAQALATASPEHQGRLLNARGALLERALAASAALAEGSAPLLPAWRRYDGVVWQYLDPATLPPATRARLLIPCALYGLTTATDVVADYRLKLHVALPGTGRLDRFWRPVLSALLGRSRGRGPVVDLLPEEHAAAFDWTAVPAAVRVRFLSAGGQRAAGHGAKAVKGAFARHLLDHGLGAALDFAFEGWCIGATSEGFTLTARR